MRLRSVWISRYKNLRDFSVTFEGDGFIDIFVGKNGSGKSNFLEALIRIFDHAYASSQSRDGSACFSYKLSYELGDALSTIEWDGETSIFEINGVKRRSVPSRTLPDNVLIYYSGQNRSIANLIDEYEGRLRRSIRGATLPENPALIGIGPSYRKLLIVILLLLPEESYARQFVEDKLGILGVRGSFTLALRRPSFATRRAYDHLDPADLFWGADGITRRFLDQLVSCIEEGATPGALHNRDTDRYTLTISAPLFQRVFADTGWNERFRLFNGLKVLDMIDDISMDLTLQGLESSELGHFSDGQFQSVYIYAVAELFKDQNCVTLLDEPDAFLHPEWQFKFLEQVNLVSEEAARTNHILLTSHSASTVAGKSDGRIRLFTMGTDGVEAVERQKSDLVRSLSAGLITFSEQEATLSIDQIVLQTDGPVLFTEGLSDAAILRVAWEKLHPGTECPFAIEQGYGRGFLRSLFSKPHMFESHPGRKFFALFDFDEAYQDWDQLGDDIEHDPARCLTKKKDGQEAYALLLPVPAGLSVRDQVLKPNGNGHFADRSRLSIELMFRDAPELAGHFEADPGERDGCIRFLGNKVRFAQEVVPTLPAASFEVFRPIFEFVQTCTAVPQVA